MVDDALRSVGDWAVDTAGLLVTIAAVVLVALVAMRLLRLFAQGMVERVMSSREGTSRELRQRAETLADIIRSTGYFIILVLAFLIILDNIGISLAPLLASAGIAGLAIAFGAQRLIADTFNGFFILLEGQFAIGDFVRVGSVSGTVEEFSLRRTVLRSADGAAITVPNSEIRIAENLSKGWSRAVIDVAVAPDADEAAVLAVFHEVLDDAMDDPDFGERIMEPPTILGMTSVEASRLVFRAMIKTLPMEQWAVQREYTRRLRAGLLKAGVPLPPRAIDLLSGP